jgi:hypothetical protein
MHILSYSTIINIIYYTYIYSRIPGVPGIRSFRHIVMVPGMEPVGTVVPLCVRVPVAIPPYVEPSATSSVNAGVLSIGDIKWRHPLPTLTWNSSLHGALYCIERQSRCVEHR